MNRAGTVCSKLWRLTVGERSEEQMTTPGDVRIGISGWRYAPWRGAFYPQGLTQARELAYASRQLASIEINGTFYALQRPSVFEQWRATVPPDFVFSVKAGRFITHIRRLRDIEAPLGNFFGSGVLALGASLGPFLWQFPPNFRFEPERFEHFLALLPATNSAAAKLARKHHDERIEGRAWLDVETERPLRHAVEIRHDSFVTPAFVDLLRKYRVALVVADAAAKWPSYEDVTADFLYLRLHGAEELYASGYSDQALDRWAAAIDAWRRGGEPDDARRISDEKPVKASKRDVYCYFDNDRKVKAPADAKRLMQRLGISWAPEPDEET